MARVFFFSHLKVVHEFSWCVIAFASSNWIVESNSLIFPPWLPLHDFIFSRYFVFGNCSPTPTRLENSGLSLRSESNQRLPEQLMDE